MPSLAMVFEILAVDKASGTFRRLGAEATGASAGVDRLTKAAAGISVVLAAVATNAAIKFESAMTRISTQAGVPQKNIKALSDAILQLSPKVGFNPTELATSLYHVESAFHSTGISAKEAIAVVKQASELSKIGNADLETTTQAVVGTLASRIKGVKDAADAAAQLNQLVGSGDTTLQKVAQGIGSGILPTAAALGLSFKDVAAATATLTDNVTPADEVMTRLRTTFSSIEKPTLAAQAALSGIHLSSTSLAEDMRQPNGLLVAMKDLQTHLNDTYPLAKSQKLSTDEIAASTKQYTTELLQQGVAAKTATSLGNKYAQSLKDGGSAATAQAQTILAAFGGAKSGSTFLTLFEEFDRLQSKYKEYGTSAQAAAKFQQAWAQTQTTTKFKLDALKASWDVFLVEIGQKILPYVKDVADAISKHPAILQAAAAALGLLTARWVVMKALGLVEFVGTLATRLFGLAAAATAAAGARGLGALTGGAAAARAILAEEAGGGMAGAARKASVGVAGIGTAAAGSGLLVGGAVILGLAGIAYGIDKIVTDSVKGLPSVKALAAALSATAKAGGGVGGKLVTSTIASSLQNAKTGNNRGESELQYFNRITTAMNPTTGLAFADGMDLSLQRLNKTIQSGSELDLEAFLHQLENVQTALGASPSTIDTVDSYYRGLFDQFNKGKSAADKLHTSTDGVTHSLTLATLALAGSSTNVSELSKALTISGPAAQKLANANMAWRGSLVDLSNMLGIGAITLDRNTAAGNQNREYIIQAVMANSRHAASVLADTGSVDASTKAYQQGIAAIEASAAAKGYDKQQIDGIIQSLALTPPSKSIPFTMPGLLENLALAKELVATLNNVPPQVQSQVTVYQQSVLSGNTISLAGSAMGLNTQLKSQADGGLHASISQGKHGGIFQWAEAGPEAFIPLSPSKRAQSLKIWMQAGKQLGVMSMASGGLAGLNPAELTYLGSHPAVAKFLTGLADVAKYLKNMAASSAALTAKLTTFVQNQQQYRDTLKSTVTSGSTITDLLAQSGNAGDLKTLFAGKIGDIKTFVAKIKALKKQGWPDAIIREIAGDGVNIGTQYANLLLSASKADRSTLIGESNLLSGLQSSGANSITALTGGTAGLKIPGAISAINKAALSGGNVTAAIAAAAAAQTKASYAPMALIHNDTMHVNSNVDLELMLKQAAFVQSAGHFG